MARDVPAGGNYTYTCTQLMPANGDSAEPPYFPFNIRLDGVRADESSTVPVIEEAREFPERERAGSERR